MPTDFQTEDVDLSDTFKRPITTEEQGYPQINENGGLGNSKISSLIIKYSGGLIKDEDQANYAILGFVAIAIIISVFLFSSEGPVNKMPPQSEILRVTPPSVPNTSLPRI